MASWKTRTSGDVTTSLTFAVVVDVDGMRSGLTAWTQGPCDRALNGNWVFPAPVNYEYSHQRGHGKILVRKEPIANILQEALEDPRQADP